MRKFFIVGLYILSIVFSTKVLALEYVDFFQVELIINQDGTVGVAEKIGYYTDIEKHGIYRYIPFKYQVNGLNYRVDIENINVTEGQLQNHPFEKSRDLGNVTLKIGDPDKTFSGTRDYNISYSVSDIVRKFETGPEIFWDATGEGWQFPINRTEVIVRSPYANITQIECYSGELNTNDSLCEKLIVDEQMAVFKYDQPIEYGDNLSVVVGLAENNDLILPTSLQVFQKRLLENIWLLLVPLPILIMFGLWWRKGRDLVFYSDNIFDMSKQRLTKVKPLSFFSRTPMVYQPIHQLTPGEAGVILDERVDNRDLIADIVQLAQLKFLKIETITKGKIFKSTDYVFSKLTEIDPKFPAHQKYLFNQLFKGRDSVKLSQLKGSFYITMNKASEMLYDQVTQKELFTANPRKIQGIYSLVVLGLIGLVAFMAVILKGEEVGVPLILIGGQVVLLPFFIKSMIQKSAIGSNYYFQAKGLKETLRVGAWRAKIQEKNLFIEEVLPFAIAFNVVDRLAKDMNELNIRPPEYAGAIAASSSSWHRQLSDFSSKAVSQMSYNPSSSKASGGSGFSGGSSGGGFGGGGGGSW